MHAGKRKSLGHPGGPPPNSPSPLSSSAPSIPLKRRFSFSFSFPRSTSFDLDPSSYRDSPIYIPPPEGLSSTTTSHELSTTAAAVACPVVPSSARQRSKSLGEVSPRRCRSTIMFGAVELQSHLSNLAMDRIAEEEPQGGLERKVPAKAERILEANRTQNSPTGKKKNRLFVPLLRRQGTRS